MVLIFSPLLETINLATSSPFCIGATIGPSYCKDIFILEISFLLIVI